MKSISDTETITITIKEYNILLSEYKILQQARAAGVDNWEWWMSWETEEDEDEDI